MVFDQAQKATLEVQHGQDDVEEALQEAVNFIDELEELDDDDVAGSESISKKTVFASQLRHLFSRVVCDEGHRVKNASTSTHRAVYTLYAPHIWVVTATPMVNRVADFLGYLNLFWKKQWRVAVEGDSDWRTLYTADFESFMRKERPDEFVEDLALWVLDPRSFAALVNSGRLVGEVARDVLSKILPLLQLRRTMASTMDVYGKTVRIGDNIVPYFITTVELEMDPDEKRQYADIWYKWIDHLSRKTHKSGGTDKAKPEADQKGLRDQRVHRFLSLVTFDQRLASLLTRTKESQASHVEAWYGRNNDHGATYYHRLTKASSRDPQYNDRWAIAEYVCGFSPKLRYLCRILHEGLYGSDEKLRGKTLIFTNWPIEQWLVELLLRNLGFDYYNIRSSLSAGERSRITGKFNDPADPVPFMIASFRSTALGVNLQSGCHRLVMMSTPDNLSLVMQTIGRIHRIGQLRPQYVWLVGLDFSYDQLLQHGMVRKMVTQLCGEAALVKLDDNPEMREQMYQRARQAAESDDFDRNAVHDLFVIQQADEMICQLLGMRCSRLYWGSKELGQKDSLLSNVNTPSRTRRTKSESEDKAGPGVNLTSKLQRIRDASGKCYKTYLCNP